MFGLLGEVERCCQSSLSARGADAKAGKKKRQPKLPFSHDSPD